MKEERRKVEKEGRRREIGGMGDEADEGGGSDGRKGRERGRKGEGRRHDAVRGRERGVMEWREADKKEGKEERTEGSAGGGEMKG